MSNQLAEALRLMVSAFDHGDVMASEGAAIAAAKQAIAAHEAAKPVAYMAKHTDGSVSFAATFAGIYRDTALAIEPLFAAPVAAASPLSLEQIEAMPVWKHFVGLFPETRLEITRAIEAANGIKEKTNG
jgi:hypothetical protein